MNESHSVYTAQKYIDGEGEKPNIVITDVYHCSRCKQDHKDLMFKAFTDPVEDNDGKLWEWYALCPTNQEPILLSGKVDKLSAYFILLNALETTLHMMATFGDKTGGEVSSAIHNALEQIKKVIG